MDAFENNIVLLIVIFIMLLGAFMIGYFFGNYRSLVAKQTIQEPIQIPNPDIKTKTLNNNLENKEEVRLEISDITEPGKVRAMKTRERAGVMSDEVKSEVANRIIDFSRIGKGDDQKIDDFQKIVGIGKSIEQKLYAIGIYNYSQLAKMTDEDMRTISKVIDFFPGRIQRDDWKGQANTLMKERKE